MKVGTRYALLILGGGHADSEVGAESKAANIWNALNQLRTPASLPSGAVLAISAEDPRVSFPPLSVNKTMRARDQGKPSPAQIAQQARIPPPPPSLPCGLPACLEA